MNHLNRPLATTMQFRAAVKRVSETYRAGYTDAPAGLRGEKDNGKRYVFGRCSVETDKEVEAIEFILWAQGVTAHTRLAGHGGVRGTCMISPKEGK